MINVLPEQQKKALHKEYLFRLISTYFFLIAVLTIMSTMLLLPTYLLSDSKENVLKNELEKFNKENQELATDDLQKIISDINTKLTLLDTGIIHKEVSQGVVNKFLNISHDKIYIDKIFYTSSKDDNGTLEIGGMAVNRTTLNNFKTALDKSGLYLGVDLPISNFVKATDIDFNIKLKIK